MQGQTAFPSKLLPITFFLILLQAGPSFANPPNIPPRLHSSHGCATNLATLTKFHFSRFTREKIFDLSSSKSSLKKNALLDFIDSLAIDIESFRGDVHTSKALKEKLRLSEDMLAYLDEVSEESPGAIAKETARIRGKLSELWALFEARSPIATGVYTENIEELLHWFSHRKDLGQQVKLSSLDRTINIKRSFISEIDLLTYDERDGLVWHEIKSNSGKSMFYELRRDANLTKQQKAARRSTSPRLKQFDEHRYLINVLRNAGIRIRLNYIFVGETPTELPSLLADYDISMSVLKP